MPEILAASQPEAAQTIRTHVHVRVCVHLCALEKEKDEQQCFPQACDISKQDHCFFFFNLLCFPPACYFCTLKSFILLFSLQRNQKTAALTH